MAECVFDHLGLLLAVELRLYFGVIEHQEGVDRAAIAQYFPLAVRNHGDALRRVDRCIVWRFILALESVDHAEGHLHFGHLANRQESARILVEVIAPNGELLLRLRYIRLSRSTTHYCQKRTDNL